MKRRWLAAISASALLGASPIPASAESLLAITTTFQTLTGFGKTQAVLEAGTNVATPYSISKAVVKSDSNTRNLSILKSIVSSGPAPVIAISKFVDRFSSIKDEQKALENMITASSYEEMSRWGEEKQRIHSQKTISALNTPVQMSIQEQTSGSSKLLDGAFFLNDVVQDAAAWTGSVFKPFMQSGGQIDMSKSSVSYMPNDGEIKSSQPDKYRTVDKKPTPPSKPRQSPNDYIPSASAAYEPVDRQSMRSQSSEYVNQFGDAILQGFVSGVLNGLNNSAIQQPRRQQSSTGQSMPYRRRGCGDIQYDTPNPQPCF